MKKTTKFLAMFGLALLMTACSDDDNVNEKVLRTDDAVQFGVETTQLVTRTAGGALGTIETDATLAEKGFGVFGCYTGDLVYENTTVFPDFMYNQKVTGELVGTDYVWSYNPVKYWPNKGYTTFFAYAPYVDHTKLDFEKPWKTNCIADMSKPYDLGDPWLVYVLSPTPFANPILKMGQSDLLIGVNAADAENPWYNQEKAADVNTKMDLKFVHALGIIGDKIRIKVSQELQDVLDANHNAKIFIDSITMNYKNLTRKAKLILNSKQGVPNWKPIVSGEVTTNRTVQIKRSDIINVDAAYAATDGVDINQTYYNANTGITYANTGADGIELLTKKGLLFIPYQVDTDPQQVEVVLTYQVLADGMEAYRGTATRTINITTNEGEVSDVVITLGKKLEFDKVYAPKVGDFYYSDGTWGEQNRHSNGALPIGAVVYLGSDIGTYDPITKTEGTAPHGLVLAFKDTEHSPSNNGRQDRFGTYWGPDGEDLAGVTNVSTYAEAYNDVNGEKNTFLMYNRWLELYSNKFNNYWASYDCGEYETAGMGAKGKWHIGTFGEWARILDSLADRFHPDGSTGTGTLTKQIEAAATGGSMADGDLFYDCDDDIKKDIIVLYEDWILALHGHLYSGVLDRNKLRNTRMYWTSTEVDSYNAIAFEFQYVYPGISDAVRFWKKETGRTEKLKDWYVRPLLTF